MCGKLQAILPLLETQASLLLSYLEMSIVIGIICKRRPGEFARC